MCVRLWPARLCRPDISANVCRWLRGKIAVAAAAAAYCSRDFARAKRPLRLGNLFYGRENRYRAQPIDRSITIDGCNHARAPIVLRSKVAPARSLAASRGQKKPRVTAMRADSGAVSLRGRYFTALFCHGDPSYDTSMNIHHLWYNNSCKACAHIPLSRYLWD